MMDTEAMLCGDENLSTPAEAAHIMEVLHRGEFVNRSVCEEILTILKKHKASNIVSGLPAGIPVASKPGGITGATTEWALVLLKHRPYIVTVMENYGLGQDGSSAIKEISKVLFEYFERLDRATPHGTFVAPAG